MDIWSWICELPESDKWGESESPPASCFELVSSKPAKVDSTQSIQLRAERTSGSNSEALVTFSVYVHGFHPSNAEKTLWVSDACPLASDKPFLPLLLQLVQEIVSRSPTAHDSTCPRSQLQKLRPEPVAWVLDSHSPESLSGFFNLVFLTRLFWLCVCDAPSEVGSLYFHSLLTPHIELFSSCNHAHVLRTFLVSIGVDAEVCFMRSLGYMLAKWLILREVGVGLQMLTPVPKLGFSYATEAHGLWILKAYAPVMAMTRTRFKGQQDKLETKDSVLKYALAHQQLEAVIQLEYSVNFHDGYIQVNTRVNNLRFHVLKLGFSKNDIDVGYIDERHFPSRIRVWIGPEIGSTYIASLTLGRSTENIEKEVKTQRIVKGNFGKMKIPNIKATTRQSTRTKTRNWRWDQDAEGNAAIFEAALCEDNNGNGIEVATNKPQISEGDKSGKKRYLEANKMLSKSGGLVFAGDEYGERVEWRMSKEMEGSVLKWRIGGQIWLSYRPNESKTTSYFETRCVEWCDEVDLPLIPCK